jgi:hypothetical protein
MSDLFQPLFPRWPRNMAALHCESAIRIMMLLADLERRYGPPDGCAIRIMMLLADLERRYGPPDG